MKSRLLFGVMVAAALSGAAEAHFVLVQPAASMVQNRLGDPQKIGPCGGVSANPGTRDAGQSRRAERGGDQREGRHRHPTARA